VHTPEALERLVPQGLSRHRRAVGDRLGKGVIGEHGVGWGHVDQAARQIDRAPEVVASAGEDWPQREGGAGGREIARGAGV
jgi:hypothetical protein